MHLVREQKTKVGAASSLEICEDLGGVRTVPSMWAKPYFSYIQCYQRESPCTETCYLYISGDFKDKS